ncbi:MAG: 3-oxoacyl-[acyl-carrier-protein] synthase III C-terminal domain-containing protein, partial [Bacteroidota bacterium]
KKDITYWCIHPGGKKIIEAIHKSLDLRDGDVQYSYETLREYGNMSSPTILFVLKKILSSLKYNHSNTIFGAAFGPGLTMETFTATT